MAVVFIQVNINFNGENSEISVQKILEKSSGLTRTSKWVLCLECLLLFELLEKRKIRKKNERSATNKNVKKFTGATQVVSRFVRAVPAHFQIPKIPAKTAEIRAFSVNWRFHRATHACPRGSRKVFPTFFDIAKYLETLLVV